MQLLLNVSESVQPTFQREERVGDNFIGEIRMFSFGWPPNGWALCNGATLQIQQNQALYALLGVQFGGDAKTNFGLPDLRGRTPVYGVGFQNVSNAGGQEQVTLTTDTIPTHVHAFYATTNTATAGSAQGNVLAAVKPDASGKTWPIYSGAPTTGSLAGGTISAEGGSQPHDNMQPFTVMNYCIALMGLFPSRS